MQINEANALKLQLTVTGAKLEATTSELQKTSFELAELKANHAEALKELAEKIETAEVSAWVLGCLYSCFWQ